MNLNGYRRAQLNDGPITVKVTGKLAARLRELHATATIGEGPYGCHVTALETYILQIIDDFVMEHRSNKCPIDETRHWARHGDEALTFHE